MRNNVGKSGRSAAMMIFRRGLEGNQLQRSRAKPAFARGYFGMQPVVAGSLCTSWPFTCSTTTDEAPQVQSSDRLAGAALAAIVKTTSKQAKMSMRPRFIRLQRHMG